MELPSARARIRGVAGEAARASAMARHAVRRTGSVAIATAKVALWLAVVITSLVVIASLGHSRHPRYPQLERQRAALDSLRRNQLAIEQFDVAQHHRNAELMRKLVDELERDHSARATSAAVERAARSR
jgi:hypothetical protein